jgi:hypothetical protein
MSPPTFTKQRKFITPLETTVARTTQVPRGRRARSWLRDGDGISFRTAGGTPEAGQLYTDKSLLWLAARGRRNGSHA